MYKIKTSESIKPIWQVILLASNTLSVIWMQDCAEERCYQMNLYILTNRAVDLKMGGLAVVSQDASAAAEFLRA